MVSFVNLETHYEIVEIYRSLINNPQVNLHILTAPSYMNPMWYTEKRLWVEKHLGL